MIYSDILRVLEKVGGDGRHLAGIMGQEHSCSADLQGK